MRKPLLPRFLLLLAVCAAVFLAIVHIQFTAETNFTRRVGSFVIQGNGVPRRKGDANAYKLNGGVSIFFGGMEFDLGRNNREHFTWTDGDAAPVPLHPEFLILEDNTARVTLAGEFTLSIFTHYTGGAPELIIQAEFPAGASGENLEAGAEAETGGNAFSESLRIPCRPLETSELRTSGSSLMVIAADAARYTFTRSEALERGAAWAILLDRENSDLGYMAIPEQKAARPEDFVVSGALDSTEYDAALSLWLDTSYSFWNMASGSADAARLFLSDVEIANAYMSEALRRGTYRSAAVALSAMYVPSADSWESSVYAGKLEAALRFLSVSERERYARTARLLNEKSPEFFKEHHVIEYLDIRGYGNLLGDTASMLRNFNPASMTVEQSAGFLEGLLDWNHARPGSGNPYTPFLDQALHLINNRLRKDPAAGIILVFTGTEADVEFNLRLGAILVRFEDESMQTLGRSLILSVLALTDETGSAPRIVEQSEQGNFSGRPDAGRLSSARIYRVCGFGEYLPKAVRLAREGLWAWTAARLVQDSQTSAQTDIIANFPAGETHYLLIRSVPPFARVQLHGADYPADPQFERSDNSGWNYNAQEQTLLVKLRHRSQTEHIVLLKNQAGSPTVPAAEE